MNADERRWTERTDQSGACPVVRSWTGSLKPHGASAFIGVHLRLKFLVVLNWLGGLGRQVRSSTTEPDFAGMQQALRCEGRISHQNGSLESWGFSGAETRC